MAEQLKRILVVDDEENTRLALKRLLNREGYEVQTAANGREALNSLNSSPVELIITDLNMPEMNGLTFLKELNRQYPASNVIMITAGFKETGSEGAELEAELTDLCRRNGARLVGPNCLGLLNTINHLNSSFAGSLPKAGRIGVFSQSGALCTSILDLAEGRNLGLSKLISIGNKADINENDMLEYFAGDPDTGVIVGYLENIVAGDTFIKTATDTCSIKPVIILKSGTSQAGQRAAASHTGVLAGADTAYGAAFKRSGVIRADTFEALFDYAQAFALQPLPKGDRVLIITNAGGPGTNAADAVETALDWQRMPELG